MYQFKHKLLEFGRGSLAELIAYDRYAITGNNTCEARDGDVVLFKHDNKQLVGTVKEKNNDYALLTVEAHDSSGSYTVKFDECRLARETRPVQTWDRWAKGAASVENHSKRQNIEDDFKWLLDGYKYVPGGRIQTMLGREFSEIGEGKSKLSAYNCLVLPSPDCSSDKKLA